MYFFKVIEKSKWLQKIGVVVMHPPRPPLNPSLVKRWSQLPESRKNIPIVNQFKMKLRNRTYSHITFTFRGKGVYHNATRIDASKITGGPVNLNARTQSYPYSQGKTRFYLIQYKNDCLAASNLFHMFTQWIKFYTFYYHVLKV